MKKRILIISELYYPTNQIGALRPSKIAKKLIEQGYQVDIYTRYSPENQGEGVYFDKCYSFEIEHTEKKLSQENVSSVHIQGKLMHQLKLTYRLFLSMKRNRRLLRNFRLIAKEQLSKNQYDVVISSFGPLASLQCGMYYKNKNPSVKWICDFRDPVVVELTPFLFRPYFKYIQNRACRKADKIVTVSNGYMSRICKGKYSDKAYMIPNGYDLEDLIFREQGNDRKEKMEFVYVGALYEGKRDLTPIFRALKELIEEKLIIREKICFYYAGSDSQVFMAQAEKFQMQDIVCFCGKLLRDECLKLQFSSDLLVLSTWNNKSEEGVFPGKFLEYMLIGKPIISITDGNKPDGEVTQVMKEGCFGVAYEAANSKKDYQKLKNYIANSYRQWNESGKISFSPNKEVLEKYNYDHIIKQIEGLINDDK